MINFFRLKSLNLSNNLKLSLKKVLQQLKKINSLEQVIQKLFFFS